MEQHQDNPETRTREDLLNQGYLALKEGSWEKAENIFRELLRENPNSSLSCLGMALAENRLHGREELAQVWETLSQDPGFQKALEPAQEEFRCWLRQDMEAAKVLQTAAPAPGISTGRKGLLCFAAVQVGLYLLMTAFMFQADRKVGDSGLQIFASLLVAGAFSGLPVILGPVYGNSLIRNGRFCRLWKILNNLVAILGGAAYAVISLTGYFSIQERASGRAELCYFYAMLAALLIHLIALVGPVILGKIK